jgi:proteasome lid subunit RPN8/RPN11
LIIFKKSDLQIIAQHSIDMFPTESCGIILGRKQDNIKIVTKIFPTKNILKSKKNIKSILKNN